MAPKKRPGYPQTTKEARRAYNERGGMSFTTSTQRERLQREHDREERRKKLVQQEATREEAAKRRVQRDVGARAERRRLGLPDPKVKVAASQPRIGMFLKAGQSNLEEEEDGMETDSDGTEDGEEAVQETTEALPSMPGSPATAARLQQRSSPPLNPPEIADRSAQARLSVHEVWPSIEVSALPQYPSERLRGSASGNAEGPIAPPVLDPTTSFFASNSQIERELSFSATESAKRASQEQSIADPESFSRDDSWSKDSCEDHHEELTSRRSSRGTSAKPTADDVALLLDIIPSAEFKKLDATEGHQDVSAMLGLISTQEWDNIDD